MSKKIFNDAEAPIYEIVIGEDDNTGIRLVSIVKDPAIEVLGLAFSKENVKKEFEFKNIQDQQMIVGPALIPNIKIPRTDDNGDLYFVYFTEDTIRTMVEKFNRDNNNKSINLDHTTTMVDAYIQQNWIIEDSYYDKSKLYGFNLPSGTWFICCKVCDSTFWNNEVKDQGKFSFSVEGLMGQKPDGFNDINKFIDDLNYNEIMDLLDSIKYD
jgi:hypothetical protein